MIWTSVTDAIQVLLRNLMYRWAVIFTSGEDYSKQVTTRFVWSYHRVLNRDSHLQCQTSLVGMDLSALPKVEFDNAPYTGKPIVYVVRASKTSYINYMKILMLAEELGMDYMVSVVRTKDDWYQPIHPERYVPAIRDEDPVTKETIHVFESTACLHYLSEMYDAEGDWTGRTRKERSEVMSWMAYQTAGMGATSKYWLYFSVVHQEKLPKTIKQLYDNCVKQWDILEKRLSQPSQEYIALKDRPTIADIAYYPFAMPYMFEFYGLSIKDWPKIEAWANRMQSRPAIQKVLTWAPTIGNAEN